MECLILLISNISFGLESLNSNKDGNAYACIDDLKNASFTSNTILDANRGIHLIKMYTIGDLK